MIPSKLKSLALACVFSLAAYHNVNAQSSYEEIEAGSVDLEHSQVDATFRDVQLKAKLYEVYWTTKYETHTWQEYECTYVPGDGKGNWHGYHNVPKDQKARALANAVKGIGVKTAEKIVYSGTNYFSPKPRTWNDFKKEIKDIERDLNVKGLSYEVLVEHGKANMANLGYEGGQDCRWVTYTQPIERTYKERRHLRDLQRSVDVRIAGSKLLSGETERIRVSYDGSNVFVDAYSTYNTYNVQLQDRGLLTLTASARKLVAPNIKDFQFSLTKNNNGTFDIAVKDLRADELKALGVAYQLNVRFNLYQKKSWCADKNLKSGSATITGGSGSASVSDGVQLESGSEYYIDSVSFERVGTPYFNGQSGTAKSGTQTY